MAGSMKTHKPTRSRARRHVPRGQRVRTYRGTTSERGYGTAWQKAARWWLGGHPLCVRCLARGTETTATEVDHVIPHRMDYALFWDQNNWQSLCRSCHSAKTVKEDGGFGRPRKGTS